MRCEINDIPLHEEQRFELDVKLGNSKYYSATIKIFADNTDATIELIGETSDNDELQIFPQFREDTVDYLEGTNGRKKFHLYDLVVQGYSWRSIFGRARRGIFQIKLTIGYFHMSIAGPSGSYPTDKYSSIILHSSTISEWLGITKKQLQKFKGESITELLKSDDRIVHEFGVEVKGRFNINILYLDRWRRDHKSQRTVTEFPPCLCINFRGTYPDFTQLKKIITDVISLFYTLTGKPVMIEKAFVKFPNFTGNEPLYLPGSDIRGKGVRNRDILLRYNSDRPFEKEQEPVFPIESFNTYFCLDEDTKGVFRRFMIYDKIENKEQKFLGLFRIVEKLSYIKSDYVNADLLADLLKTLKTNLVENGVKSDVAKKLTDRFKNSNSQKINAEGAIFKFMKSLGAEHFQEISHLKDDLPKIVKTRNSITHCEPYALREGEIDRFILILNYLSILLLWRAAGLANHKSFKSLHRYLQYSKLHPHDQ